MSTNIIKVSKLVFLDFDGVMTSVKNKTSYLCENAEKYRIDPEIKETFEKHVFAKYLDMKVVVISAWTKQGTIHDRNAFWEYHGIKMPTPLPDLVDWLKEKNVYLGTVSTARRDFDGNRITKFQRVKEWIETNQDILSSNDVKMLVIDDDDSDFNGLKEINNLKLENGKIKYLKTDYEIGFSESDLKELTKFFD